MCIRDSRCTAAAAEQFRPESDQGSAEEHAEAGDWVGIRTGQTATGGDGSRAGRGADEEQEGACPTLAASTGAGGVYTSAVCPASSWCHRVLEGKTLADNAYLQ